MMETTELQSHWWWLDSHNINHARSQWLQSTIAAPLVSPEAKDLISKLVKDSSKRPSLQKIMEHPWITKNADPTAAYSIS